MALCLLGLLLVLAVPPAARAAAPIDRRSSLPNQSSELPGAGYLLTDPLHGRSSAYWAGAYRSIPGQRGYCIDDFYDYPNPSYRYRAAEVSGWAGRPGSNLGAHGHTAQRIIWIVNSYGQSSSPGTDAAVSMAINLLTGSAPFLRSYSSWFRPQLIAINPAIVSLINRMLSDSDRLAGPYRTRIAFGPAPAVGGVAEFTVEVRSAREIPVPGAHYRIVATAGLRLATASTGRTASSGVGVLTYTALRAGRLAAIAEGIGLPNTTMRLGYSPTHSTSNFSTGSQRVALVSARRLTDVRPAAAQLTVRPPTIGTTVLGGTGPRPVGAPASDRVQAAGLVPNGGYQLTVRLQDSSAVACGTTTMPVRADPHGRLAVTTAGIAVCGTGRDTFTERLADLHGTTLAVSGPGQPTETFPVAPTVSTMVRGGVGPRLPGAQASDRVVGSGLPPGRPLQVQVSLLDSTGRHCGTVTGSVSTDQRGRFDLSSAPVPVCGLIHDSFTEVVRDRTGSILASTPFGQPGETFPVSHRSVVPSSSPAPPGHPPAKAVPPSVAKPVPRLAATGSAPIAAVIGGLLTVLVGTGLLLAGGRGV
jgi:hypothetical protein